MPELPEVETIVQTLRPTLLGRTIDAVLVPRPDIIFPAGCDLAQQLTGRRIADIFRRGKRIVFQLHSGARFYIHLGMSGRLILESTGKPRRPHTHLILRSDETEIRFVDPRRFGGLFWLGMDIPPDEGLGPEPLEMLPSQLAIQLARTRRAVKTALLDQTLLAGLGNIYADESLFTAAIHPLTPANRLSPEQIDRLHDGIQLVLQQALSHGGSTLRDYRNAHGQSGSFQNLHRVYDRAGSPCLLCQTHIERIVLGGRSTHFCPKCQTRKANKKRRHLAASENKARKTILT